MSLHLLGSDFESAVFDFIGILQDILRYLIQEL